MLCLRVSGFTIITTDVVETAAQMEGAEAGGADMEVQEVEVVHLLETGTHNPGHLRRPTTKSYGLLFRHQVPRTRERNDQIKGASHDIRRRIGQNRLTSYYSRVSSKNTYYTKSQAIFSQCKIPS
jgi:hypothetical protein